MSVAAELFQSSTELDSETRPVLGPAGNRVRVSESPESKRKKELLKKKPTTQTRKLATRLPESVVLKRNGSIDSSCSSDSYSSVSSVKKKPNLRQQSGLKSVIKMVVPTDKVEVPSTTTTTTMSPPSSPSPPVFLAKRCDWITPNSDPLYASFHDEEWGVPVHDDRKLFELLILSSSLAELNWPTILSKRDAFRKLFDNFDISSVAKFTEKKIASLKSITKTLLSEPKLRAVVDNAKQILKVQEEFGSFSNYCWSFVNHKPIRNGFRYVRQVPVKTPKAEVISKDLMRRGFRCVGPTVVYSFMQVAGITNDHLLSCFRYQECNSNIHKETEAKVVEETDVLAKALDKMCSSPI